MLRVVTKFSTLAFLALLLPGGNAAAEDWRDPFLTGDPALYPAPRPVETVTRAAEIRINPSMAAVPAGIAAVGGGANGGARIEVLGVIRSEEIAGVPAPEGMEAVVLVTRWENIHPKALIEKSKLENGADRTQGAGALSAGGSGDKSEDMVEMDVAYVVPMAGRHLWLVAGGEAWGLRPESASLPHGADPLKPIGIKRFGETREVRLAWFVPKGLADLELRLFDYENGHIAVAAAGDAAKAAAPRPAKPVDTGAIGEMKVSVLGLTMTDEYAGQKAPEGWRYALVDLLGLGTAKQGDMGALIQLDPTKYAWLMGDGGVLRYGLPPEDGSPLLVFTPEIPRRQTIAFLVPATEENFRIGLRGRADVAAIRATALDPAAVPETVYRVTDPGALVLGLVGLRWEGEALVADFLATPESGGKGVEIDVVGQLALVAGDAAFQPDASLTRRLYRQPPAPFVLPPGTAVRFEVAFPLLGDAVPTQLNYKGFAGKGSFPLDGQTITGTRGAAGDGLAAGELPAIVPKPVAIEPAAPAPGTVSVSESPASAGEPSPDTAAAAAPDAFRPPMETPTLMPLTLPPFDGAAATAEVEPNQKIEEATPLGVGLAATGQMAGKDDEDWFAFTVDGEPQLWTIEGSGPGIGRITVVAAGKRELIEARTKDGAPESGETIRIDNLLLLPGRYWIDAEPRKGVAGGAYSVRAVPLGRPERTAEFEPNDALAVALPLQFGVPRHGLIGREGDVDLYQVSLGVATHVLLTLAPPTGLETNLKLEGNGISQRMDPLPDGHGRLGFDTVLNPGEYTVSVYATNTGKSDSPYELRLDRLDPFNPPVDLEPNNDAPRAASLGGALQFAGTLGPYDGRDLFRLPPVTVPTTVTITGGAEVNFDIARIVEGSDRRADYEDLKDRKTDTSKTIQATLDPGVPYVLRVEGQGQYRMALTFDPDPGGTPRVPVTGALEVKPSGEPPVFAAYRDAAQEASVAVTVTNRGSQAQDVTLEAIPSELGWQVDFGGQTLSLAPGKSAEAVGHLYAASDRSALRDAPIFIRARGPSGAGGTAALPVKVSCAAAPLLPTRERPLPAALLGGLNVAWNALGGQSASASERARNNQAQLLDGMTPLQQGYEVRPWDDGFDIDIKLAGGNPVQVAGIALSTAPAGSARIDRAPFTVLASLDGNAYEPIYSGVLEPVATEESFVFDAPRSATHLRVKFNATDGIPYTGGAVLAEVKAIAVPGSRPLGEFRPNLADPALGGHLVWVSWDSAGYTSESTILTETAEKRYFRLAALQPMEWVVGFNNDRAARIARLEWRESDVTDTGYHRAQKVAVSASVDGPTGPWVPLADWALPGVPGGAAELVLDTPVWARFLRFSVPPADETAYWHLAETLRIFEQAEDESYRSVLGEWGHYRRAAYYEMLDLGHSAGGAKAIAGGDTRAHAAALAAGEPLAGRVEVGGREDWFRIDAPKGIDRLEFAFRGDGAGRLEPMLEDNKGGAVALEEADEAGGARIVHARVTPGATYYLKIAEARRSIMIVWDNSSSVGPFHETMYRTIAHLADDIRPGQEVINIMPFSEDGSRTLIPDWTGDPLAVKRGIGEYDRNDSSSDAEVNLLGALRQLETRPGNRGIVLLTDADSGGESKHAPLWRSLSKVRPRIFAVELQLNQNTAQVSHFQDLMQDWAAVNNGHYSVFRSKADLDVAFDRAACRMRQPAEYDVAWKPAPGAGTLIVEWEKGKGMAGAAIELILDASGSMISAKNKIGGKLKMEVAREVMLEIVGLLPADTQAGLRFYGHRKKDGTKGACEDSELVAPIAKLDRARLESRIKGVKALGGTPIAYSLTQAGKDMANVEGPRLIVLVTDGKEECKGNPAAAVEALKAQGIDARIDIVGFALTDKKDKADMARVAELAGGRFFDAQNRDALAASIQESLAMPFEVTDSRDRQVGAGLTGQSTQALYQGYYSVVVHTARGDVTVRDVRIVEGQPTRIVLAREGEAIKTRVEAPPDQR